MGEHFERTRIDIVGHEGRMGRPLHSLLAKAFSEFGILVKGVDQKISQTASSEGVNEQKPEVVVFAVPVEQLATLAPEYMQLGGEAEAIKFYINIGSVQEATRDILTRSAVGVPGINVIVHVHPYFGPAAFKEGLSGKKLIYSGVDVVGDHVATDQLEAIRQNWKQLVEHFARTLPEINDGEKFTPMEVVDLSEKKLEITLPNGTHKTITGPALHDYVAALTQAPYHALRLAVAADPHRSAIEALLRKEVLGDSGLDLEWKNVSRAVTESIVRQNPSVEVVQRLFPTEITLESISLFFQEIARHIAVVQRQLFPEQATVQDITTPAMHKLIAWAMKQGTSVQ